MIFLIKDYIKGFCFYGSCVFILTACNGIPNNRLTIVRQVSFDSIPSGSGMVIRDSIAYIIGDDATDIYLLNFHTLQQKRILLPHFRHEVYREPKAVKHDFESTAIVTYDGHEYLLAAGSGSKAILRDSLLIMSMPDCNDGGIRSLQHLYEYLRRETKTDAAHWNIEGMTVAGKYMVLANRGNNSLIFIRLNAFMTWLFNPAGPFPVATIEQMKLPAIQKKEARLSGLSTVNEDEILFCASVEDTPDRTADGPVLGSLIGSYSLSQKAITSSFILEDGQGKPLKEKIEALDLLPSEDRRIRKIVAIADNDNGASQFFELEMPVPR